MSFKLKHESKTVLLHSRDRVYTNEDKLNSFSYKRSNYIMKIVSD